MTQPIQAVQIYFEHPFGAEREVLREFFSFVGCLVKTTMMPVETMLEKHKSLVNPGSERITHLFLTDKPPEGIVLSKNEMWCSFRILKRELAINGKEILHNADQKISAEQFEKTTLDVIIRRIWKDDEAATQSLLHINASFWQLDLFAFLQIKSAFQALKMGELMALPMRGNYYLPEAAYLNKMADAFINMAKQCSMGPDSIYAVYAYVNAQRHLRELLTLLEAHAPLRIKLYAAVKPVQELLSELNKIYRIDPDFLMMLKCNGIEYQREKMFPWMGKKRLDFFLPGKNIAIECQGVQHFYPYGSDDRDFEARKQRDIDKYNECTSNGVQVLYFMSELIPVPGEMARKYQYVTSLDELLGILNDK